MILCIFSLIGSHYPGVVQARRLQRIRSSCLQATNAGLFTFIVFLHILVVNSWCLSLKLTVVRLQQMA